MLGIINYAIYDIPAVQEKNAVLRWSVKKHKKGRHILGPERSSLK